MNIIITRKVIINGSRHEIEVPERIVITVTANRRRETTTRLHDNASSAFGYLLLSSVNNCLVFNSFYLF